MVKAKFMMVSFIFSDLFGKIKFQTLFFSMICQCQIVPVNLKLFSLIFWRGFDEVLFVFTYKANNMILQFRFLLQTCSN